MTTSRLSQHPLASWLLFASLVGSSAHAGDWVMAAGSEEGRSGAIVPWGFTQLLVESQPWSAPVTGLQAPALQAYNGASLAADIEGVAVSVRRARVGLRGIVPGTDERINMLIALEAGQNGLTRGRGVVIVDASVSVRLVEGLRLRLGQFKLPTADEAIENNPSAAAMTTFSPFVSALLIESDVENGKVTGPASSLRDVGAQLFDAVDVWSNDALTLELSWAAMASMGRPSHQLGALSLDPSAWWQGLAATQTQLAHVASVGPELTGRLQLSLLFDPKQKAKPTRDELSAWLWSQQGQRAAVVNDRAGVEDDRALVTPRRRTGVGGQLRVGGVRVRAEAVLAEGMILQPPALLGQAASVVADGVAHGGSVDVSVARVASFKLHPFVVDASVDWLQRNPSDRVAERTLQALTLGAQWKLNPALRLLGNVTLRRQLVGDEAPKDAAVIAAAASPTVSLQMNLVF